MAMHLNDIQNTAKKTPYIELQTSLRRQQSLSKFHKFIGEQINSISSSGAMMMGSAQDAVWDSIAKTAAEDLGIYTEGEVAKQELANSLRNQIVNEARRLSDERRRTNSALMSVAGTVAGATLANALVPGAGFLIISGGAGLGAAVGSTIGSLVG